MASNESLYGCMSSFPPAFDTEPPPIEDVESPSNASMTNSDNFGDWCDFSSFSSVNFDDNVIDVGSKFNFNSSVPIGDAVLDTGPPPINTDIVGESTHLNVEIHGTSLEVESKTLQNSFGKSDLDSSYQHHPNHGENSENFILNDGGRNESLDPAQEYAAERSDIEVKPNVSSGDSLLVDCGQTDLFNESNKVDNVLDVDTDANKLFNESHGEEKGTDFCKISETSDKNHLGDNISKASYTNDLEEVSQQKDDMFGEDNDFDSFKVSEDVDSSSNLSEQLGNNLNNERDIVNSKESNIDDIAFSIQNGQETTTLSHECHDFSADIISEKDDENVTSNRNNGNEKMIDDLTDVDMKADGCAGGDDFGVFNDVADKLNGSITKSRDFGVFNDVTSSIGDGDKTITPSDDFGLFNDAGLHEDEKTSISPIDFDEFNKVDFEPEVFEEKETISSDDFGLFNDADIKSSVDEGKETMPEPDDFGMFNVTSSINVEDDFVVLNDATVQSGGQEGNEPTIPALDFGGFNSVDNISSVQKGDETITPSNDFGGFDDVDTLGKREDENNFGKFDDDQNCEVFNSAHFDTFQSSNEIETENVNDKNMVLQLESEYDDSGQLNSCFEKFNGSDKPDVILEDGGNDVITSDFGEFGDIQTNGSVSEHDTFGDFDAFKQNEEVVVEDDKFPVKTETAHEQAGFAQFDSFESFTGGDSASVDTSKTEVEDTGSISFQMKKYALGGETTMQVSKSNEVGSYLDAINDCFPLQLYGEKYESAEKRVYDIIGHLSGYVKSDKDLTLWQELNMSEDDSKYSLSYLGSNSFRSQIISFSLDYKPMDMDNGYSILVPEQATNVPSKNTLLAQSLIKAANADKDVLTVKPKDSSSETTSETTSLDLEFFISNVPVSTQNTDLGTVPAGNLLDMNGWDTKSCDSQIETVSLSSVHVLTTSIINQNVDTVSIGSNEMSAEINTGCGQLKINDNGFNQLNENIFVSTSNVSQEDKTISDAFEWGETVTDPNANPTDNQHDGFGSFAANTDDFFDTTSLGDVPKPQSAHENISTSVKKDENLPPKLINTSSDGDDSFTTFFSNTNVDNRDNIVDTFAAFTTNETGTANVELNDSFSNFVSTESNSIVKPGQIMISTDVNDIPLPSTCSDTTFTDFFSGVDVSTSDPKDSLKESGNSTVDSTFNANFDMFQGPPTSGEILDGFTISPEINKPVVSVDNELDELSGNHFVSNSFPKERANAMVSNDDFSSFANFESISTRNTPSEFGEIQMFGSASAEPAVSEVSVRSPDLVSFSPSNDVKEETIEFSDFEFQGGEAVDLDNVPPDIPCTSSTAFSDFARHFSNPGSYTDNTNNTEDFSSFTSISNFESVSSNTVLTSGNAGDENLMYEPFVAASEITHTTNIDLENWNVSNMVSTAVPKVLTTVSSTMLDFNFPANFSNAGVDDSKIVDSIKFPSSFDTHASIMNNEPKFPVSFDETLQEVSNVDPKDSGGKSSDLFSCGANEHSDDPFGTFVKFDNSASSFQPSTTSTSVVNSSQPIPAFIPTTHNITRSVDKNIDSNDNSNIFGAMSSFTPTSVSGKSEGNLNDELTAGMLGLDISKRNERPENSQVPVSDVLPIKNAFSGPIELTSQESVFSDIDSPRHQDFRVYSQLSGTSIEVDSCSSVSDYQFCDFTEPPGVSTNEEFADFQNFSSSFSGTSLTDGNPDFKNVMEKSSSDNFVTGNISANFNQSSIYSNISTNVSTTMAFSDLQSYSHTRLTNKSSASSIDSMLKSPLEEDLFQASCLLQNVSSDTQLPSSMPNTGLSYADPFNNSLKREEIKSEPFTDFSEFTEFSGFQDTVSPAAPDPSNSAADSTSSLASQSVFNEQFNNPFSVTDTDVSNSQRLSNQTNPQFQYSDPSHNQQFDSQLLDSLSTPCQQYGQMQTSLPQNYSGMNMMYPVAHTPSQRFPGQSQQFRPQGFPNQTQMVNMQAYQNVHREGDVFQNDMMRMRYINPGQPGIIQGVGPGVGPGMGPGISHQTNPRYGYREQQVQNNSMYLPSRHQRQQFPRYQAHGGKDPFASFTIRNNAEQLDISLANRTLVSGVSKPKLNQIPTRSQDGPTLQPSKLNYGKGGT